MATSIVHSERRRKVNIVGPGVGFLQANWACSNQHKKFALNRFLPKCKATVTVQTWREPCCWASHTESKMRGKRGKQLFNVVRKRKILTGTRFAYVQDAKKYGNGIHIKNIWIRISRCALLSSAMSSHSPFVRTWLTITCPATSLIVPTRYRLCLACPDCTRRISWIPSPRHFKFQFQEAGFVGFNPS